MTRSRGIVTIALLMLAGVVAGPFDRADLEAFLSRFDPPMDSEVNRR